MQPGTPARLPVRSHGPRPTASSPDPDLLIHGRFRADHDTEGLTALLARSNPPTAIFAGNDAIAVGVLREARPRGIHVPEDLSLVGFDGAALRAVLRQFRGEQPDTHRVELATQFAVRESTTLLR
ncbi:MULTISPECIES: substrate-binding domain-containing protein [unclassified Streptomyces]|uniref:substrate-binding domain-containing protein n=1 Tax=unclassified Streptomyces TaxID=2593676 RepID=UPI002DDBA372|nr:substrate-binding domain-containing protein [Streptomyces sp. NBC_01445]WSE11402.1 substrate-binding domain-containing protein [Streptomyces sp. NBC_01445]